MPESYDDTKVPHIGETSPCIPEVHVFTRDPDTYRIVLHGKQGLRGYKESPVIAVEYKTGTDALGCATWVPVTDPALVSMLGALFMSFRAMMKESWEESWEGQEDATSK